MNSKQVRRIANNIEHAVENLRSVETEDTVAIDNALSRLADILAMIDAHTALAGDEDYRELNFTA